jgi:hypothetical protein
MSANKIYKVTIGAKMGDQSVLETRLIRGKSAAKVNKFVAADQIAIEPLSVEDARKYAELPIEDVAQ